MDMQKVNWLADKNLSQDNLLAMGDDGAIMQLVTSLQKLMVAGQRTYSQVVSTLIAAFPGRIGQFVKPPLFVMAARTNREFKWTPHNGPEQTLPAGGYIFLSWKDDGWDIWGVGAEFISSYALNVEPVKDNAAYMSVYGAPISIIDKIIGLNVPHSFGPINPAIQASTFSFAVKQAPVIEFEATSDWMLWGSESADDNPYIIKKGDPVLLGVWLEGWRRNPVDFAAAYIRVDTSSLTQEEILRFLSDIVSGQISFKELNETAAEYMLRITCFGISANMPVIETSQFLAYKAKTTTTMRAVKLDEEGNPIQ